MNRVRLRNSAIAMMPIAFLVLASDLHVPGWGEFTNPVFYAKWVISRVKGLGGDIQTVAANDRRLAVCQGAIEPGVIDANQTAMRQTLAGESEELAVSLLGTPACRLADDTFRWLTDGGLSLDVTLDEWGRVNSAKLSNQ
ncbi:MAG: hypothetical protein ACFB2W_06970 [Leptolyngbyaceae cyanobacterium]